MVAAPVAHIPLPRLRVDQSVMVRHEAKTKAIAAGRRFGKTVMAGATALSTASAGGRVAWIVPSYRNGRPLWRWAEAAVSGLVRSGRARINRSERTIEFPGTGGFLGIYSADNDSSIRGEWFNLAILDEAAQIAEETWTDVVQPTLADANGDAILISTPKGKNWFWREWQRGIGQMDGEYAAFTAPSSANPNPHIKRAAELAKLRVPDETYRQEWLAEFVSDALDIFHPDWWLGINRYDADKARKGDSSEVEGRYITIDTAMKDKEVNDYTACSVFEVLTDYRIRLCHCWQRRLTFPDLVPAIETTAAEWNRDKKLRWVSIEDRNSGTGALQTIKAASPAWLSRLTQAFEPSGSKDYRARQAAAWCSRGGVLLPHPSAAVPWLGEFEREIYAFPDVEHDDRTDTFSQGVILLQQYLARWWAKVTAVPADERPRVPTRNYG